MTRAVTGPADARETCPTATTTTYEIRVAGHLDDHWSATLGDLTLVRLDDGTTSLAGSLVDQAQLHGVLARLRDLGVPLLTLRTLDYAGTSGTTQPEAVPPTLAHMVGSPSPSQSCRRSGARGESAAGFYDPKGVGAWCFSPRPTVSE
jgi:hypothetical protein